MRLPPARFPLLLRPLAWYQRARYGRTLEPTALWAYRPRALVAFLRFFGALRSRRSPVSARLRALVSLRVSQLNRCAFCVDLNAAMLADADAAAGRDATGSAEQGDGLPLADEERLALAYAEAMTATPPRVDEALFARMREAFAPEAIVELTAIVAFQNMSARFNAALDAAPHGFAAEGGAGDPRRPE